MKLWFLGSGQFGAACLERLASVFPFDLVVTAPPRPAGRGLHERPTPVEIAACARGLEVHHSARLSREEAIISRFYTDRPDLLCVVDFGQILLPPFLDAPRFGCINIHPSLLPAYRGAAPVVRTLLEGRSLSGATVFRLVRELDAGPIFAQEALVVLPDETAGELAERLAALGSQMLVGVIESLRQNGQAPLHPQRDDATYAAKIIPSEARIDWNENSKQVHDRVRAFNPIPGAWAEHRGKRLKIWRTCLAPGGGAAGSLIRIDDGHPVVACGSEAVSLLEVQAEGKGRADTRDWLRGARLVDGERLFS